MRDHNHERLYIDPMELRVLAHGGRITIRRLNEAERQEIRRQRRLARWHEMGTERKGAAA